MEPLRERGGSAERTKCIPKTAFVKASVGMVGLLDGRDEKSGQVPDLKWPPLGHHFAQIVAKRS
jgi:hypothetical protein